MKKFILLLILIVLIVAAFIIGRNIINSHPVSTEDQKAIAAAVNGYYEALEAKNPDKALFYTLNSEKGNSMDKYINLESKKLGLAEILINVYQTLHRQDLCNYQYVFYDKLEKAYFANVNLNIKYKGTSGGVVNEILYLNKYAGKWKIIKIKTPDRYVMFRTSGYIVDSNIYFLQPIKQ